MFGVPSLRGAFRDRHGRGAGCGGRGSAPDERHRRGRRSRVVLTPRRWRSSSRKQVFADDGDKKARSPGRVRRKPLKPLRREGRTASAEPVCSCAFLCTLLHARPRVQRAPGFPCALWLMRAERADQTSRETCGEIAKLYPAVIASAAKQSMAQHTRKLDCSRGDGVCQYALFLMFAIQGSSRFRRSGLPARSNSHSVVVRGDCTRIPLATGRLERT